jgi:predicted transcriptional regulator of viral defense system
VDKSVELRIGQIARRQHGNVTREQLLAIGLGSAAITYRCRNGRLRRVHLGVYAVGRPPETVLQRAAAAVLACGPAAALSHGSALTLWGFDGRWQLPFHVAGPTRHERPGIVTHELPSLARKDIRTHLGVRVTSPARTLLDCTPSLTDKRLARIAADARRQGKLHVAELADVAQRFANHPGKARLDALLGSAPAGGAPTRSEFEDAFLVFCQRHALPRPLVNTMVCGHEVDALFAAEQLIVELDGWDFHRDRYAFEADRDRDADALAAGLPTVRVTWERMSQTPGKEAARLHAILARRRES